MVMKMSGFIARISSSEVERESIIVSIKAILLNKGKAVCG